MMLESAILNYRCGNVFLPTTQGGIILMNLCGAFQGSGTICRRNGDCTGGEVCIFAGIKADKTAETLCGVPLPGGVTNIGDVCSDTRFCANSFCLDEGKCSAVCTTAADCGAGFSCSQYQVTISTKGEKISVSACLAQP